MEVFAGEDSPAKHSKEGRCFFEAVRWRGSPRLEQLPLESPVTFERT
jgi:hypothetical protein